MTTAPKITDIAPVSGILTLRFRPSARVGSAHLMTDAELDAAIEAEARRVMLSKSLVMLIDARVARETETDDDRIWRLRRRIAWEVTMEKRQSKRFSERVSRY